MNFLPHPRQTAILELARETGRVEVDGLSGRFAVSVQTIRKDLNDLCEQGLLQRIHGGAIFPQGRTNLAHEARRNVAADGKNAIGRVVAGMIPDNASVILNIGTTTEMVAEHLRRRRGLLAVTNNINVANILRDAPDAEIIIAGGIMRQSDGGIVGEAAVDLIRQFKVDFAIIGTSAIDTDGALLDFDYREVRVSQAIIEQARSVILVADNTKFERSAPVRIGHLSNVSDFVTDVEPPGEIIEICNHEGVRLHVAGGENGQQDQEEMSS